VLMQSMKGWSGVKITSFSCGEKWLNFKNQLIGGQRYSLVHSQYLLVNENNNYWQIIGNFTSSVMAKPSSQWLCSCNLPLTFPRLVWNFPFS
jgi:hypothetical protein